MQRDVRRNIAKSNRGYVADDCLDDFFLNDLLFGRTQPFGEVGVQVCTDGIDLSAYIQYEQYPRTPSP